MTTTKQSHAVDNALCHYIDWALAYELSNFPELERGQTICEELGINPAQRIADFEDVAREYIQESALSCEVRSGWHSVGQPSEPEQFRIVFSTGGPHLEMVGDLDGYGEAGSVELVAKDWGENTVVYEDSEGNTLDSDVLEWVANCFYWSV